MSPFRRRRPVPPEEAPTRVAGPPPPAGGEVREEVEEHIPVRRRRIGDPYWPWLLLLLLIVLAGLGALWYFTREDDKAVTPDVVGLREAAAVERVEDAGLDAVVRRSSSARPRGLVYAQRPGGERS